MIVCTELNSVGVCLTLCMGCSCKTFYNIGVGRFRILGDQGLEYWVSQGGGGGKFLAGTSRHTDVDATQRRRNDVISTSCAH